MKRVLICLMLCSAVLLIFIYGKDKDEGFNPQASTIKGESPVANAQVLKDTKARRQKWMLEHFRTLTLCSCIERGNNRAFSMSDQDASCRSADYSIEARQFYESLVSKTIAQIKADSADRDGRVAEGMDGKLVMSHCLRLYKSSELESAGKAWMKKEAPLGH